jgi:hypothetical protein
MLHGQLDGALDPRWPFQSIRAGRLAIPSNDVGLSPIGGPAAAVAS